MGGLGKVLSSICLVAVLFGQGQSYAGPAHSVEIKSVKTEGSNGLLLESSQPIPNLSHLVSDGHFVRTSNENFREYVFYIHRATLAQHIPKSLGEDTGQGPYSVSFSSNGDGLNVKILIWNFDNSVTVTTSDGKWIGIYVDKKPSSFPQPKSRWKVPAWFFKDALIAARYEARPEPVQIYMAMEPYDPPKGYLLALPYQGVNEEVGYQCYAGSVSMYDWYEAFIPSPSRLPFRVLRGKIREREAGKWASVWGAMAEAENGISIGFAVNQVVVSQEHAGIAQMFIYHVPGIYVGP